MEEKTFLYREEIIRQLKEASFTDYMLICEKETSGIPAILLEDVIKILNESSRLEKLVMPKIAEIESFINYILHTRPLSNSWYPIPNGRDDPPLKNIKGYGRTATYSKVAKQLIVELKELVSNKGILIER